MISGRQYQPLCAWQECSLPPRITDGGHIRCAIRRPQHQSKHQISGDSTEGGQC
jgi:hypothetical protein